MEDSYMDGLDVEQIIAQSGDSLTPELMNRLKYAQRWASIYKDKGFLSGCVISSIAYTHGNLVEKNGFISRNKYK